MLHVFGTPEHWLGRAQEAREMADKITDLSAKRAMLEIGANYEKVSGFDTQAKAEAWIERHKANIATGTLKSPSPNWRVSKAR